MRTILIGDIHGCYDEFMALLKKTEYDKDNDRFYNFNKTVSASSREENKQIIIDLIVSKFKNIIK